MCFLSKWKVSLYSTVCITFLWTRGHFWVYQFIKRPCTFKKTRQSRWVAHLKPHYEPIKHIPVESEVQLLLSIHICTLVCILIVYLHTIVCTVYPSFLCATWIFPRVEYLDSTQPCTLNRNWKFELYFCNIS